jgi:hypothetical protein
MRRVVFLIFALATAPAFAQERRPVEQTPGFNPAGYYCRSEGRYFDRGETACLRTPDGGRVAECRMETNVMSWNITDRSCERL